MTTLSKSERDNLDLLLPAVKTAVENVQGYGVLEPIDPTLKDAYNKACRELAQLFVIPAIGSSLLRALECYNQLDAELLALQETNAELEDALESANRDLESFLPRFVGGDRPSIEIHIHQ